MAPDREYQQRLASPGTLTSRQAWLTPSFPASQRVPCPPEISAMLPGGARFRARSLGGSA